MISCRDWWPWTKPGYITITRRQNNNQWIGGITAHPAPPKFRVQKFAGKVLAWIFLGQDGILVIDYLPKGRTINAEYYSSLLVQLKDILKEKRRWKVPRGSCPCMTMPRFTGHLQPRRNWPTWASNVLITYPILRIWPRRTTTCSLDWKNNWDVVIFRPTRRSLLPQRPGWKDNVLNLFLSDLQKLEEQAEKYIELRGEYVEQIPSLVAVACFLRGRAKDLSATPHMCVFLCVCVCVCVCLTWI